MGNEVHELLDILYNMVNDAWGLPLGAEKCVIERDKVLDLLDEIKAKLPVEIAEAKRLIEEIVKAAKSRANSITRSAEEKSAELRRAANEYTDDTLRRTEEAINEALEEVRRFRAQFRSVAVAAAQNTQNIVPEE